MDSLYDGSDIGHALDGIVTYEPEEVAIYLLGSLSSSKNTVRNQLSDIDLLIVPSYVSLENYAKHLTKAFSLHKRIQKLSEKPLDLFLLSSQVVDLHLKCLTVLAALDQRQKEDIIFGVFKSVDTNLVVNARVQRLLYQSEFERLRYKYEVLLPVGDTGSARKIAKQILRTLKVRACAITDGAHLPDIENRLLSVKTFIEAEKILYELGETWIIDPLWQQVLDGETVEDWAKWMRVQDDMARFLAGKSGAISEGERRLYGAISRVRNMLLLDLKDIIIQPDDSLRQLMISAFADNTASVVARLAFAGITSLADFGSASVPQEVKESYEILVEHLRGDRVGELCLAASLIILEYALKQSLTQTSSRI